ncbi:hypothetical protein NLX83_06200 [Allokutzneria sp. A3M-2-11 16]|uniref:WXG100 family type VII secretion target n=1 Tax=Allokutzneria sp. A3M-2-11 16 TaxID=2962043 RepID=UPI0020B644B0|nr:hypothetical protein [Allokutzneria sp. A3M-2-11 16]MCP3798844.1 hypothetical protein [Allokutzneria sp. A3M-2-11 16]
MGFGTNTDEMAQVAGALRTAAQEVPPRVRPIEAAANEGAGLGLAHGAAAKEYAGGLRKLVAAATSFVTATEDFARRLEQTKGGYQWVENRNARTVGGK